MANITQDVVSLAKKKQASKTWMLLDDKGDTMLLEVDKYAIMHRVGIHARDLRILDPLLSYPSTILGRERAIVLNLEVRIPCPVPSGCLIIRGVGFPSFRVEFVLDFVMALPVRVSMLFWTLFCISEILSLFGD